jgi:hypothetical protein
VTDTSSLLRVAYTSRLRLHLCEKLTVPRPVSPDWNVQCPRPLRSCTALCLHFVLHGEST